MEMFSNAVFNSIPIQPTSVQCTAIQSHFINIHCSTLLGTVCEFRYMYMTMGAGL
jgi:hypothetical protein